MNYLSHFIYALFPFFFLRKKERESYNGQQASLSFLFSGYAKKQKNGNDVNYIFLIIRLIKKCSIFFCLTILCGCGIQDYPISPSEAKLPKQKQSLFPLEHEKQGAVARNVQKKSYTDTGTLFQAGGFYSAGFGLDNDTLDDVFERLKPKSARPKGRIVTPLDR